MLGFVPSEFRRFQGEGEIETIILSDTNVVPSEVPEHALYLSKENATAADFVELFTVFDESFKNVDASVVVCCLGTYDISHVNKRLEFNEVTKTYDFHISRNHPHRYVSQTIDALIESICELKSIKKVVSFDPLSRDSTGFHNSAVFAISNRVKQINEKHAHYITHKRYQRKMKRKKTKDTARFPLSADRFDEEGMLLEAEKRLLAKLAIEAVTSETDIVIDDAFFSKKF